MAPPTPPADHTRHGAGDRQRSGHGPPAALTAAQEQQWVLHHFASDPAVANLAVALRLTGELDETALAAALTGLVTRHEALRTGFTQAALGPQRWTASAVTVSLPLEDLRTVPRPEQEQALASGLRDEAWRPFDLSGGRLLRARLFRLAADQHVLCLTAHRLGADEDSVGPLLRELAARYRHRAEPATTAAGSVVDHRHGQAATGEPELAAGLRHWQATLRGAGPLELPTDRPRPARMSGAAARVRGRVQWPSPPGTDRAEVALAGVATLLSRYSGQTDLLIATARSTRTPAAAARIGPFTETVPMRIDLSGDPPAVAAVPRVRAALRAAQAHPAGTLAAARAEAQGGPPMRVAVNLADPVEPCFNVPGVAAQPVELEPAAVPFDVVIGVRAGADGAEITVDYATDLFDRPRIVRMVCHLEVLLVAAAEAPQTRLSELPLLTADESGQVLARWQGPQVPYPRAPVHQQILEHARRSPDSVAVRLAGQELTYGELDRRSELLARRLRAAGVGHEQIVAICMERCLDAVLAMVGVLRAGAAFAVLDPDHPPRRMQFILADTGATVVLTHTGLLRRMPDAGAWTPICLDRDWPDIEQQPAAPPLVELADENSLAYVLYTSGSTGQPKGVLIEHGSLSNFALWAAWLFDLGPQDRMLQHMALVFDFSEGEIFTALACGATMVMLPEPVRTSPEALGALIAGERITCVFGPPAVLNKVDLPPCPDLRYVVVGGDICTGDLVTKWNTPGRRFINGYGPTEATVGCTGYECEHRTWTSQPPIGRAMPNRTTYILDEHQQPCPAGVPGELYIGGVGLARGYLNRRALTAERFIPNPFRPGERMYRTGDLCVWTDDGQIQFLGRIDTQVKVNGLRVELEEIEAALTTHPSVRHAAVTTRADASGAVRLVGHVVPQSDQLDPAALRTHLAELLPTYLVPGQFLRLESLPLTPVGKVDRAALRAGAETGGAGGTFQPPRTPVERQVATLAAELLELPRIGVEDDFFALGGTSMQLVTLVARLNQEFAGAMRVADVSACATVAGIAHHVTAGQALAPHTAPARTSGGAAVPPDAGAEGVDALALLERVEEMSDTDVRRLVSGSQP